MTFDFYYQQYYKFIHYLLHRHHITYNYDEYFQLLSIKLWELTLTYQPESHLSFRTFVNYRLKFYLIDLLRQAQSQLQSSPLTPAVFEISDNTSLFNDLMYADICQQLSVKQRTWLQYYLQGFRQKEIQEHMHVSATTVHKYKTTTFTQLRQLLTQDDM